MPPHRSTLPPSPENQTTDQNDSGKRISRNPKYSLPTLDEHATSESRGPGLDSRRRSSIESSVDEPRDILAPLSDIYRGIEYLPPRGTISSTAGSSWQKGSTSRISPRHHDEANGNADNSSNSSIDTDELRQSYEHACRKSKVSPNSSFIKQIGSGEIILRNCELTAPDVKAICVTILKDREISTLDLTSNCIGVRGLLYVVQLLKHNKAIDELNISDNWIGAGKLKHLTNILTDTKQIKRLNISGNGFNDKDGHSLADIIENNRSIEYLNASRNEFGDEAGRLIGPALAENEFLVNLDLSWNHLRGKGADAISKAIAVNTTLESLNISWNGFGFGGTVYMSNALKQNQTLTELDMANNRIHQKQFLELLDGVMANRTLRVLKVALNPIPAVFTSAFILGIRSSSDCGLRELDLSGIVVDREFEEILKEIHQERLFICHYERSLFVNREKELEKLNQQTAYNVDPVNILFFMKSKQRAVDFFRELDKDGGHQISREALANKFKIENVEITSSALDKVFEYFGKKDKIDLATFMDGERRHRRKTLAEEHRRRSVVSNTDDEISETYSKQGGMPDSKERRLSQAVTDFMQRRKSVATTTPSENSKWKRLSGALENGLLKKTSSADELNSGTHLTLPKLDRERSKSLEDKTIREDDTHSPLPQIRRNRRMSLVETLNSQRSRKSSLIPALPTIVNSEAWEEEE